MCVIERVHTYIDREKSMFFKRLNFYVWYASKVLDYKLAKSIFFLKPFLFYFWSLLFKEKTFLAPHLPNYVCTKPTKVHNTHTHTHKKFLNSNTETFMLQVLEMNERNEAYLKLQRNCCTKL